MVRRRDEGTESRRTMSFDFGDLLVRLEDGERSLSTIAATIWTGPIPRDIGTAIDDLHLARCIAKDRDFPAPDWRGPVLVVLTDCRLLICQEKRSLRKGRGLRRVLGEVPLDRTEGIEPTKVAKENRSPRSSNRLGFVCLVLLCVLAGLDTVGHDSSLLENTPVSLPKVVLNGLVAVVCLVAYGSFVIGAIGNYLQKCVVVEVSLSNGKSILLQLYDNPDSFLSAFRSVSDHDRSVS
jgi:hypothetical protein